MIKKALALFAVLFLFSGPATADFDGYVEVTNNTGYDIYYLYYIISTIYCIYYLSISIIYLML